MTLIRTDIGCADSEIHDKDTKWDPTKKTFFLNEIEYGGTTYFIRHLKFDSVPLWSKLYVNKALEIRDKMAEASESRRGEAKQARVQRAIVKKPASAGPLLKKPAASKRG